MWLVENKAGNEAAYSQLVDINSSEHKLSNLYLSPSRDLAKWIWSMFVEVSVRSSHCAYDGPGARGGAINPSKMCPARTVLHFSFLFMQLFDHQLRVLDEQQSR